MCSWKTSATKVKVSPQVMRQAVSEEPKVVVHPEGEAYDIYSESGWVFRHEAFVRYRPDGSGSVGTTTRISIVGAITFVAILVALVGIWYAARPSRMQHHQSTESSESEIEDTEPKLAQG